MSNAPSTPPTPAPEPDVTHERVISMTVNGVTRDVPCNDHETLIELLRERLGLVGSHAGCLNGDCGSCTVRIDGQIIKACLVMAPAADGADVTTIEALQIGTELSVIQTAFWDHDGFQCGFCLPGHLFAALDLLEHESDPTDQQIRQALVGNLCRCTGYEKIIESVRAAAVAVRETAESH